MAKAKTKVYDYRKARVTTFEPGKEVLALLPLQGKPLAAKFTGSSVVKKVGDLDYFIATADTRKVV